MTDTEKLNTTCKRLQLQCFRNYVLCNAVDEKLNNLDNEQQKINAEIDKLHKSRMGLSAKLNKVDNEQQELNTKINTLSQTLNAKIAKQQRGLVNTDIAIIMMSLMRLMCVIMFAWWFMHQR